MAKAAASNIAFIWNLLDTNGCSEDQQSAIAGVPVTKSYQAKIAISNGKWKGRFFG
jgi:hypothetical protein